MSKLFTVLSVLVLSFVVTSLVDSVAWAKVEYDSSQLMMQNSEQVTTLVRKRIDRASAIEQQQADDSTVLAEPEALEFLKDALRIALARPDQDGLRGILFARIRRETNDLNSTETVLSQLTDESLENLKDKKASVAHQATYILVLENLMAEIKPELERNKTLKEMVEKIRDADIKVSKDVQSQQKLKLMRAPTSPSKTAESILPKKKKKSFLGL